MTPSTHLVIAKMLYKFILEDTGFKLNWPAFAYGNIKPDLNRTYIACPHTMENSLDIIDAYSKNLVKNKISIEKFSVGLGVICHFVCDYFCMHHGKAYWKKAPLAHGVYEVNLDMRLLRLYMNKKIYIKYRCKAEKSIKDLVMKIHKKYSREPKGMLRDIKYAIVAAAAVCRLMISWVKVEV